MNTARKLTARDCSAEVQANCAARMEALEKGFGDLRGDVQRGLGDLIAAVKENTEERRRGSQFLSNLARHLKLDDAGLHSTGEHPAIPEGETKP